jgi:hypothetical protein
VNAGVLRELKEKKEAQSHEGKKVREEKRR